MKKKFDNILKLIIVAFLMLPLLPSPVNAQQLTTLTDCSIVQFESQMTAELTCSARRQSVSEPKNCNVGWTGLTPNETCCCTKSSPAPTYTCTWRVESTYARPNDPTFHSTKTGGCYDTEVKGFNCDPNNRPPLTNTFNTSERLACCCPDPNANKPKYKADVILPQLSININTIELTKEIYCENDDGTGDCYYPWIAEYINGIYKYGFGVAGILAAIMLMAGGIIWLVSTGDASKISQAKNLITGSVTGLIILSASYMILTTINPKLTSLKHISVKMIDGQATNEVVSVFDEGENPYQAGCDASRLGNYSICEQYSNDPPKNMKSIPGSSQQSTEEVITKYLAAQECVKQLNGGKELFKVTEGWRPPKTQLALFRQLGYPKAAYPCCSNHGKGTALDLARIDGTIMTWEYNDSSGLTDCMKNQGLYAKLKGEGKDPNEPWHWSPSGR